MLVFLIAAPAEIVGGPTNRSVRYGTEVRLECIGAGIPTPMVDWYKDDQPVKMAPTCVNTISLLLLILSQCTCEGVKKTSPVYS